MGASHFMDNALIDSETGQGTPVLTIVADNGDPSRSLTSEAFMALHPKTRLVCTRMHTSRAERVTRARFGTLKYEWSFPQDIKEALGLAREPDAYNHVRRTRRSRETDDLIPA